MDTNRRRQGGRGRRLEGTRQSSVRADRVAGELPASRYLPCEPRLFGSSGKDATQRATEIWKQALKEYEEPAVDPAIREALDAYVAQRRARIGSEEP